MKKKVLLFLLAFITTIVKAQQITNASGGDAMGLGGSVAYSVGQVIYTTNTGITGSVAQGVQHAYEVFVSEIKETELNISLKVFPNPTYDFLQLKVEIEKLPDLSYQLVDVSGKLIEAQKINSDFEMIRMENLPSTTYFLKIIYNYTEIKIFKIIKIK